VKCVELTFRRHPSKSHDIPAMLAGLPAQCEIREDLEAAWRGVPQLLKGTILYRGMDHNTGGDPRDEFRSHKAEIEEALEIAERDFLAFSEKHLEKFETGSN